MARRGGLGKEGSRPRDLSLRHPPLRPGGKECSLSEQQKEAGWGRSMKGGRGQICGS